jgi:hypothetical protein
MDIIRLYYYTSVPLLTCNMLFYSITSISASISSSQNVIKFISENKDCDSIIFKNEIADIDLENKLRIIESLIYDITKKFCNNNEEFERAKKDIQQPQIIDSISLENNEFALVEIKSPTTVLERIDEPIKIALISTSETMQNINTLIIEMRDKINNHNKSYMKNFLALSLQIELKNLHRQVKILDSRLHLLLELLKIYLPIREK